VRPEGERVRTPRGLRLRGNWSSHRRSCVPGTWVGAFPPVGAISDPSKMRHGIKPASRMTGLVRGLSSRVTVPRATLPASLAAR
jgi:hypothetical protein